jgi:hypothetical protein
MGNFYVGGGTLHFRKEGTVPFVELASVEDVKVNVSAEFAEAYDHSGTTRVLAKKVPKKFDAKISFKTTDTSPAHLAMAVYGTLNATATKTDDIAGWTNKSVTQISFGQSLLLEGAFKFVSKNASGAPFMLEVYKATVKPTGDINLQSQDVSELSFEGDVLLTDDGKYADIYMENE